ncbi:MAG: crossover junction endodeoxyribonuclease RuvC [Acidimicrobiales bacterium]|nr:crossover junction endodeoxyribonuclease RuvC [Acidimicrobiales bacterium]
MFVLGIDPGLSRCGYCCLEATASGPRAVALGVITTPPGEALPLRLLELQRELRSLLADWRPGVLAVERVLFQVNVRTAMSVGQASGIAMAEAAGAGCEVVQYSPNQVKLAVAGTGAAPKAQVQRMVQVLLGLPALPEPPDAADAAALALCHLALAGGPAARAASALGRSGTVPAAAGSGRPRNAVGRALGPPSTGGRRTP